MPNQEVLHSLSRLPLLTKVCFFSFSFTFLLAVSVVSYQSIATIQNYHEKLTQCITSNIEPKLDFISEAVWKQDLQALDDTLSDFDFTCSALSFLISNEEVKPTLYFILHTKQGQRIEYGALPVSEHISELSFPLSFWKVGSEEKASAYWIGELEVKLDYQNIYNAVSDQALSQILQHFLVSSAVALLGFLLGYKMVVKRIRFFITKIRSETSYDKLKEYVDQDKTELSELWLPIVNFKESLDNKRLKTELEFKICRQELEKVQRESDLKSQFLAKMSHELRTPMNAILGFSQLLLMHEEDAQKKSNLQDVLMAGEHLQHLIDDVLDLTNIDRDRVSISLREVVIDDLIKECLLYSDEMINKNKLKVVVTGDLQYKVHADPARLKEVLLNLISNAAKYNVVEGTITIEVKKMADLDRLWISVTDTGHGLSQEQQRHLFEPFERLGAEATEIEGTGIGLVISKNLIELMHGKLGFESTHGRGSTFWVELDLADNGSASMELDVNN